MLGVSHATRLARYAVPISRLISIRYQGFLISTLSYRFPEGIYKRLTHVNVETRARTRASRGLYNYIRMRSPNGVEGATAGVEMSVKCNFGSLFELEEYKFKT